LGSGTCHMRAAPRAGTAPCCLAPHSRTSQTFAS
jgi:hypothetical protein